MESLFNLVAILSQYLNAAQNMLVAQLDYRINENLSEFESRYEAGAFANLSLMNSKTPNEIRACPILRIIGIWIQFVSWRELFKMVPIRSESNYRQNTDRYDQ